MLIDTTVLILQFIGDNLEFITLINGIWLLTMLVVYFFINKTQYKWKNIVNRILMSIVMAGEFILIFMFGYVYWDNIRQGTCVQILPDTAWVKSNMPVYFITGKDLARVNLDGTGFKYVLEAPTPIREYHLSPDGNQVIAVTDQELYLIENNALAPQLIDSLGDFVRDKKAEGIINGVKWAPDSRKFCYSLHQWSQFASQDSNYVFDLNLRQKKIMVNPLYKIPELYWSKDGNILYYERYTTKNIRSAEPYEIQFYWVSLETLKPELIREFRSSTYKIESMPLKSIGIDLYVPSSKRSFTRTILNEPVAVSDRGTKVIFEKNHSLYYVKNNKKTKLYRFQKEKKRKKIPIQEMVWLPGDQYLIIIHEKLGVLVVNPTAARMGILFDYSANTIGWYTGPD